MVNLKDRDTQVENRGECGSGNDALGSANKEYEGDSRDKEMDSDSDGDYTWDDEFLYFLRTNQLEETARILNQKLVTNLNYQNKDGNSALHYVCANNLDEAAFFLLKVLKVNYDLRNNSGNSPLQWAVQNKCVNVMKVLLGHHYRVNGEFNTDNSWGKDNELEKLEQNLREKIKHIHLEEETVRYYGIESYSPTYGSDNVVDILKKNKFGKSVLSEAFECNNLEVLQLILEHPIASVLDDKSEVAGDDDSVYTPSNDSSVNVDKNLMGSDIKPTNSMTEHPEEGLRYVLHELQFIPDRSSDTGISTGGRSDEGGEGTGGAISRSSKNTTTRVKVREIAIDNEGVLNAVESELDLSGQIIWEASIIASYWLSSMVAITGSTIGGGSSSNIGTSKVDGGSTCVSNTLPCVESFRDKAVLELGAGCGLLGMSFWVACNHYGQRLKKLTLSDYPKRTLDNLRCNLEMNLNHDEKGFNEVEVVQLNWKDFDAKGKYDVIIASDLVYDRKLVEPLVNVISQLLNGWFLYTYKVSRDGADLFLDELKRAGFEVNIQQVSKEFERNPFPDKSMKYCLMFFPDLESDDYNFLTARKPPHV